MENLARYIIRASFSQERMTYIPDQSMVVYQSKDSKHEKTFDALEWLAAMCSHVPNKGEQMVKYYGYYSNVTRGKLKKGDQDGLIPCILEPDVSSKEYRKNWARLTKNEWGQVLHYNISHAMKSFSRRVHPQSPTTS